MERYWLARKTTTFFLQGLVGSDGCMDEVGIEGEFGLARVGRELAIIFLKY